MTSFNLLQMVGVGVTGQWQLSAGAHNKGYSSLPTEALAVDSPTADRTVTKQQSDWKSPVSLFRTSSTIDVPQRSLERLIEAAKGMNADTPSKRIVKLGHDHTLWQAASTEDYWYGYALSFLNLQK